MNKGLLPVTSVNLHLFEHILCFFYRLKYFKSFPHDEPDFEKIMVAIAGGSPPSAMVLINPHRNIKGHLAFEIYIKPEDQNSIFFIYFETFGSQFLPFFLFRSIKGTPFSAWIHFFVSEFSLPEPSP